ncbi:polysaccharide biosynthesis tyrosine autokinase [Rhodococcus sp. RS1C4]|nr:polysaccharide biosynthesis tyrosine autokinase [Rhodococcus sp. RS1C4]
MGVREYALALRSRWLTIVATTLVGAIAALLYSLLATPVYQASTRFFVSTAAISASDVYQSNLASQQRVVSYTDLLSGRALSERVIDQLGLGVSPNELSAQILATSKPNSVLLDAAVNDTSPERARDIANSIGAQFPTLVSELETPSDGGTASATVAVAEQAELPTQPISPKKVRNVALGITVGFLLGVIGALIRDRFDNTVKDAAVLQELTDSVLVGNVPYDKQVKDNAPIDFGTSTAPVAEAYRELRINLKFLAVDNPPRMLLITSAIPGEGKSTTAVNLALSLAEMGNRVVIVDADLRRPRIADYLGIVPAVGVSSVISHDAKVDEVVQASGYENVWAVAAGPPPPNPSELLGSSAAQSLLKDLQRAFDYVVVDSPPVLPVTDATVLATQCDGAILVTRYGHTTKDEVSRAAATLETVGAALLGVVMTVIPTSSRPGSRYGYDAPQPAQPPKHAPVPTAAARKHLR